MTDLAAEVYSARVQVNRLQDKLADLGGRKRTLEVRLSEMGDRVRLSGRRGLPPDIYRQICVEQGKLKKRILDIEREIQPLSREKRDWFAILDELEHRARAAGILPAGEDSSTLRGRIVEIRDRYLDFAEDQTRVNSMRVMAAEFANCLTQAMAASPDQT
jgi:hypothetical protein